MYLDKFFKDRALFLEMAGKQKQARSVLEVCSLYVCRPNLTLPDSVLSG